MALLARKSGWIIAVDIIKTSHNYIEVQMKDTGTKVKVQRKDTTQKVFEGASISEVEGWILEGGK